MAERIGPEWADYAWERWDAEKAPLPLRVETWNGSGWSEKPDPSECLDSP